MKYEITCDSCEFADTVDVEWEAYSSAKDHEHAHPTHLARIQEVG